MKPTKRLENGIVAVWYVMWALIFGFGIVSAIGNDTVEDAPTERYLVVDLFDTPGRYLRTNELYVELGEVCVVDGVMCPEVEFYAPFFMWVDLETGVVATIHGDGEGQVFAVFLDDNLSAGIERAVYITMPDLSKENQA